MLENMTHDDLVAAYNEADKPNVYGAELLRRIHEEDREVWGMSGDALGGKSRA